MLLACAQYLAGDQPGGPFRIYHQSFRDFLIHALEFPVDAAGSNQAIGEFFYTIYNGDWLSCEEEYALRYTPTHLIQAAATLTQPAARLARKKLLAELPALLEDFAYLHNRLLQETGSTTALEGDLQQAARLLSSGDAAARLSTLAQALRREKSQSSPPPRKLFCPAL